MTATPQAPALTADELEFLHGMFDLARAGETARLVGYVEEGLPVDLTNGAGDTLLILAAYHDHPGTVRALLEHGADHARVDDRGQTALAAAVFRRSPASVAALLAAGADPDHGGRPARQVADFFGLDDMTALLPPAGDPGRAGR